MSTLRSRGRNGSTVIPNWRWEDPRLDEYDIRIIGWLLSHVQSYLESLSARMIADRLGIARGRVAKSLSTLAKLKIIEMSTAERGRIVITIDLDVWVEDRPPTGHHMASHWPPHGQSGDSDVLVLDTQEVSPPTPPDGGETLFAPAAPVEQPDPVADSFERFWTNYPRKVAKPAAARAWRRAVKVATLEDIVAGLFRWAQHWEQRGEPQFVPYPATWLNQQRWNDQPPVVAKPVRALSEIERFHQRRTGCSDAEARAYGEQIRRRRAGDLVDANTLDNVAPCGMVAFGSPSERNPA